MSDLMEQSLRGLVADVLDRGEATTVDDLARIFPAVERADLERMYEVLTLPIEAMGSYCQDLARAAGATRVRHLGHRRYLILAPHGAIRFLADEGTGTSEAVDDVDAFERAWWLDQMASHLPAAWHTDDYQGPDGRHAAIILRWADVEAILGHPHGGDADDDARLKAALLASGAPAWAADAEGWLDEHGWGLIGPRLAD
jgi:hypothetical protein